MIRKIRNILAGLHNIWKWRKVIYKDKEWDYWFVYEILKTKLKFQAEYLTKYGYHENSITNAVHILECVDLIDKVQNEYYIDRALDGLSDHEWTDEMFKEALQKQDDAKKLLFKTLEDKIEHWWS
jgi:hypothetical protein